MSNISYEKLCAGDRKTLSKAITLIEGQTQEQKEQTKILMEKILAREYKTFRIGISGTPGAGKSTLIEAIGIELANKGKKVAVLSIDPSSPVSGGSILGDKIRMEKLSAHPNAYIRPSPNNLSQGGIAQKTQESISICEAAGFEYILIESVGVGQSEYRLKDMVDLFTLVISPLTGDSIQGIKKGILEISDLVIITKADGPSKDLAFTTQQDYQDSLSILKREDNWEIPVIAVSSLKGNGISEVLDKIHEFINYLNTKNLFNSKRLDQKIYWAKNLLLQEIQFKIETKLLENGTFEQLKTTVENKNSPYKKISEILNKITI